MSEPAMILRDMRVGDLPAGHALSSEQHWPHRLEDWEFMLQAGFGLVAEHDGALVGTCMAWHFGADAAKIGMVIVSNRCQGRGIGRKLMQAMVDRLDGRSIALNATAEGLRLYGSLGFARTGSVFQHQSADFSVPVPQLLPGERVRPMVARDANRVAALFSRASGIDQAALLSALGPVAKGVVLTRDNQPAGFALLRRFGRGWSIGPVVAADPHGARTMVSHWLAAKMGKFCRLDVTGAGALSPWLAELGLPCVGEVAAMVRGPVPQPQGEARVFALVSQALG